MQLHWKLFAPKMDSSEDENEREDFEVSEWDRDNEFNPNRTRRPRSKEDAIYGIFNDEDDQRPPSFRGKAAKPRGPMSFVAAKSSSKKMDYDDNDDDDDEDDNADDDAVMSHMEGSRPGFGSKLHQQQAQQPAKPSIVTQAPSFRAKKQAAADPFKQGQAAQMLTKDDKEDDKPVQSGSSKQPAYSQFSSKTTKVDKDFAKWTKHSNGVGMKLLAKMGWKPGKGLGVAEHGIARPIDVKLRRRNAGLQDSGERTEQSKQDFGHKTDSEDEEVKQFREQRDQWRKDINPTRKGKRKTKPRKYTSAAELAERNGGSQGLTSMKIIDMTGATTRVVDSMQQATTTTTITKANQAVFSSTNGTVPMPELQHNVNILIQQAEADVIRVTNLLKHDEQQRTLLREERADLAQSLKTETRNMNALDNLLDGLAKLESSEPLDMAQCLELFGQLYQEDAQTYVSYDVAAIAKAAACERLRKMYQGWNPFQSPALGVSVVEGWRELLLYRPRKHHVALPAEKEMSDYEHMLWTCVVPPLRNAIMSLWSPREPEPLLNVLDVWQALLPGWLLRNLLEQLVLPRVRSAVETWDPRTDPVPVHQWLQPLASVADDMLREIYPAVRFKLASCLQAWQPSDQSALAMLLPWRNVWSKKDMRLLLARSVVPKLASALRNMDVSPAGGSVAPLHWVLNWQPLLTDYDMAQLLVDHFFPNFLTVLCKWLRQDTPDFQQVTRWYLGWKSELPAAIVADSIVQTQLKSAVMLINLNLTQRETGLKAAAQRLEDLAIKLERQRKAGPHADILSGGNRPSQAVAETKSVPVGGGIQTATPKVSLRDLISQLAEQRNITFAPKVGRTSASGKPLYSFGSASLYIDQDVVYAKSKRGADYLPVSLDALPKLAAV
eukprot:TRINITY_DN11611_c0_g1_i3.p1 TRINITY_DN11611_c0_g1~~TRINITY_DN11611_c0_g1_i3.p1  ORF type:complete len:891 (+),score=265.07 TRINITY_DN11611_c0_g1_i3:87-2759(+)